MDYDHLDALGPSPELIAKPQNHKEPGESQKKTSRSLWDVLLGGMRDG